MNTFVAQLAAARSAREVAADNLRQAARKSVIDPDIQAMALERDPIGWAEVLRQVADVVATLPALRAELDRALNVLGPLRDKACSRCDGTGEYAGASSYIRDGKKICFKCHGAGC